MFSRRTGLGVWFFFFFFVCVCVCVCLLSVPVAPFSLWSSSLVVHVVSEVGVLRSRQKRLCGLGFFFKFFLGGETEVGFGIARKMINCINGCFFFLHCLI